MLILIRTQNMIYKNLSDFWRKFKIVMISLIEKYWIRTKFQNDNGILKSISYVKCLWMGTLRYHQTYSKTRQHFKDFAFRSNVFYFKWLKISFIKIWNETSTPLMFHHLKWNSIIKFILMVFNLDGWKAMEFMPLPLCR